VETVAEIPNAGAGPSLISLLAAPQTEAAAPFAVLERARPKPSRRVRTRQPIARGLPRVLIQRECLIFSTAPL
jgi:hypothetical protein